ncbi:Na+/H+ antiporter NhaC family protein, partial [Staphylococcus saprophyticus]
VILCGVVALAIGSSWSTMATVGVASMGIGVSMGISPGMVAGAVICGAYFGDKMSPLSDTTNLASGLSGVELFEHIK